MTQRLQLFLQNTVIAGSLAAAGPVAPPLALRVLTAIPLLRRLPARLIGLGIRPEHIAPRSGRCMTSPAALGGRLPCGGPTLSAALPYRPTLMG